ncbi:MAG: hypothetical protein AAGE99_04685 [Chlamydiota bacterium]
MKNYLKNILEGHERLNPGHGAHNDMAMRHLESHDTLRPAKPAVMHAAHGLDGHHERLPLFEHNYDNKISEEDKDLIDEDVMHLAETNAILHHPEALGIYEEDEPNISENKKLSKKVMRHLLETVTPEDLERKIKKVFYGPLLEKLVKDLKNENTILAQLLYPKMVEHTGHHPDHYATLFKHMFLQGALNAEKHGHWHRGLKDIVMKGKK